MNFVAHKVDFFHGLQTAFNAISTRATLPILSNFLIEVTKKSVRLTSTDLEVSIVCVFPAEVSAEGNVTVPAKKIVDIVRELPDEDIEVKDSDNHQITISCGKSIFRLNGLAKDEYPVLPKIKSDAGVDLPQTLLHDMIRKTLFAVSTDETRYVLNGVLFSLDKKNLCMVATDGHRLAFKQTVLENDSKMTINQIVPSKALQELLKIMSGEGTVNVQLHDNQIIFSSPNIILMSRLIDGQFPNYEQVIPKSHSLRIEADTNSFMAATKRVSLMASDKSNSVKYHFNKGSLVVSANTPEIGDAQEELEVIFEGDALTVAYNAKYVLDVLKNIGTEKFVFELTSNLNPGVLKPALEKDFYTCVIMPMRT